MSHTVQEKQKLLNRVRRIRGQLDAIERALEDEHGCVSVLQQITSCRGAMNGLLAGCWKTTSEPTSPKWMPNTSTPTAAPKIS